MYPSQQTFPWNLEQENVFTEVSRNDSAGVWRARACKTCFQNLRENGDMSHSETLCMINRKLTRFPQSLTLETKRSGSRVLPGYGPNKLVQ